MATEQTDSDERTWAALDALGLAPFAATAFEDLTRLAAEVLKTPMALISLVDRKGGHLKAQVGFAGSEDAPVCVFRTIVTDRFGIVTSEFGNVTGHFGDVTDGVLSLV